MQGGEEPFMKSEVHGMGGEGWRDGGGVVVRLSGGEWP
jgi:hypothetical protein